MPDEENAKVELYIEALEPVDYTLSYYDEDAITAFNNLGKAQLPILPWGYHWEKPNNTYGIYKLTYAYEHSLKIILYGPDEKSKINYNFIVDGNNFFTLAHTRTQKQDRLGSRERKYPSPINTNASGYKANGLQMMPGHCVDHVDSIIPSAEKVKLWGFDCNSSYNAANYLPEIQKDYWGLYMRKGLVEYQRKSSLPYAQLAEYIDQPNLTSSNSTVPSSVYFYCLDKEYSPNMVAWINWDTNHNEHKKNKNTTMYTHMKSFSTPTEAAPTALLWDVNHSDRAWRHEIRNKRILGHKIRNNPEQFRNAQKDQLYAYGAASSLEIADSYSSISAALAASPVSKKLAIANLEKATQHGFKLLDLDEEKMPVDNSRLEWVKNFHKKQNAGFESDDLVDAIKKLAMK
jgi:hypothetical protein